MGDWQYELGDQIVDACVSKRERNGGLIDVAKLVRMVSKLRGVESGVMDVLQSIKDALGTGYEVIEVRRGRKIAQSVVKELDEDQEVILAEAQVEGERIAEETLVTRRGWKYERTKAAEEHAAL